MHSTASRPASSEPRRTPDWRARLPFFYGWVIVGSTFVVFAAAYSVWYSFSVFYVALLEEFGWARASTAGVFSVYVTITGLGGIVGGALLDRFGPGRVMAVGGVLMAASLVATSRITQLWEFYLYFGVLCGVGLALTGWVSGVTVVSRWFSSKQGIAIGIASAGIGLGTVVMAPLSQYIISTAGWRSAYLFLAAVTLVGIAPQVALLQVGRPEELGLRPDGRDSSPSEGAVSSSARRVKVVDPTWASRAWSLPMAARTSRFWLMVGCYAFSVLAQQTVFVHQTAYFVDGGYDRMLAASIVGLVGFLSMFAKVALGEVGDRIGRERSFTIGSACGLAALFALVLAGVTPSVWIILVFAAFFTIGYAAVPANLSTAAADLFASRNFGAIYGAICIGQGLGSAFGAWLAGFIFDTTGSYMAAFAVAAASIALSGAFIWLAAPRMVRRVVRGTHQ